MKKFLIFFALLIAVKNSFGQCSTIYVEHDTTVYCTAIPLTYYGTYFEYAEAQTLYLTSSKGCDSIVTLNVNIYQPGSSNVYDTVKSCALPFYWGGNDIYSSGVYPEDINIYGCNPENPADSVVYLHLTVINADTLKTDTTVCSAGLPFYWNANGQQYDESGTYVFNPGDEFNPYPPPNCFIYQLNLTVVQSKASTTDTAVCTNHLPFKWNGQNFNATGTYTVPIKTGKLCDSLATLNLIVNSNPTSTTNITTCANQLPFIWNGKNYDSTSIDTAIISHAGCDSLAIVNLTIKPVAAISAISPTTATKGESVIIMGKGFLNVSNVSFGGIYASHFIIENDTTIIATVDSATSGTVSVTNSCNTISIGGFTFNSMQGSIGIGTNKAPSKLTVAGGDIYVTDIGSGIILKSPDGTCWKLYMSNTEGGVNGLHVVQIPCPQ
jgi:hypothetical protein